MPNRTHTVIAAGLLFGAVLFAAATLGPSATSPASLAAPAAVAVPAAGLMVTAGQPNLPVGGSLEDLIASLQTRLESVPDDHASWATLGLAYVQQARTTVDPSFYGKADGALARSLQIDDDDNFLAYAGLSALAAARHDFPAAEAFAERGLEINAYSAILYGALSDAQIQLGDYDAAFESVQQMVDLSPDTASLSRASYTWELRGDIERARDLMERALDDAPSPADRAFTLVHLGGLSFDQGDAANALEFYNDALEAKPDDIAALAAKARAEAALGQTDTAVEHWMQVVTRAPEPGYVFEFARLLESLGRTDDAEQQWAVFDATQQRFAANGVLPDATATLAAAERGRLDEALDDVSKAVRSRPFLDVYDAQAWVLHLAGRHEEALQAIDRALQLGTRNARFHYHAGMIALALDDTVRAERELTMALSINPEFDPLSAPDARETLAELQAGR